MTNDRDRSIEHLLRRAGSSYPELASDCLDAETLAALADDTLTAAARRDAEAHLADCDRCQALTAAMVRAEGAAGTLVQTAGKRRLLGWLVPAAAVATAVALWVLVPGQRPQVAEQPLSDRAAAVTPQRTGPREAQSAAEPGQAVESPSPPVDARVSESFRRRDAAPGSTRISPPASPSAPVEQLLKAEESANTAARADSAAPRQEPAPATAERQEQTQVAGALQASGGRDTAVAGGLPPSREASADRRSLGGGGQASGAVASPPPSREARAASESRVPNEAAARQDADRGRVNESAKPAASAPAALTGQLRAAAVLEIASANPRLRWRVAQGSVVQHSTDGGASWTAQQTGAAAQLTAGSSPSADVCWFVGRGGIVLRTVDAGRSWERAALPQGADPTSITASTGVDAVVSLADGRRLATSDGGRTWSPDR